MELGIFTKSGFPHVEPFAQTTLRICIQEGNGLAFSQKGGREANGNRGLSRPTLLLRNANDLTRHIARSQVSCVLKAE
jgi:hypothetical protein